MLPDIATAVGQTVPVVGGWMVSSANELIKDDTIELAVATTYRGNSLISKKIGKIQYYLLPCKVATGVKYDKSLEKLWQSVSEEFKPDVVHIHGTEFTHGLAYIRACGSKHVVVSIQGLVSVYHRYYTAGMSIAEQLKNITLRDILRMDTIWQQKKKFRQRGLFEKEYIRSVQHIIGRTSWDKAHVLAINPTVNYHFCNETLRAEFYKHRWSQDTCEKHTIFLSQASYPIKGLHMVLKALPFVLRSYPDTKLYVAGPDITDRSTLVKRLKQTGYAKYISKLIQVLNLQEHVRFTGLLNEQEICQQYLRANVFVCPSSIENSPNSLGEAQLLGVPCIASYVGGVPDMVEDGVTGFLYRFEEAEMLAEKICEVFSGSYVKSTLDQGHAVAMNRHDGITNGVELAAVYSSIDK